MADFVSELNSLDFSKYIGGPIQAAVDAQNSAAMAQVDFIKQVGLQTTTGTGNIQITKVTMIDFSYDRTIGEGAEETTEKVTLKVPLLTMLSIPALRIDEMTIDFNCKLNSVETHDTSQSLGVDVNVGANAWKIKFNVSASYQYKSSDTEQVERTYSMKIHVKVVNDELPAGLDRLLNILEGLIDAQIPATATTPTQS